jgi:uncharacterized protein YqgQ
MGIYVTWGNNHFQYDKTNKDYNSESYRWNRYSENIKRGYVLYSKTVEGMNSLQISSGLMELEDLRNSGFNLLKKKPKRKVVELIKDTLDELYHKWGILGDDFSLTNNPYDLELIKKENSELTTNELYEENDYLNQSIIEFKEYEQSKENLNTIKWFEEQLKFNLDLIEKKIKKDEKEISK